MFVPGWVIWVIVGILTLLFSARIASRTTGDYDFFTPLFAASLPVAYVLVLVAFLAGRACGL